MYYYLSNCLNNLKENGNLFKLKEIKIINKKI